MNLPDNSLVPIALCLLKSLQFLYCHECVSPPLSVSPWSPVDLLDWLFKIFMKFLSAHHYFPFLSFPPTLYLSIICLFVCLFLAWLLLILLYSFAFHFISFQLTYFFFFLLSVLIRIFIFQFDLFILLRSVLFSSFSVFISFISPLFFICLVIISYLFLCFASWLFAWKVVILVSLLTYSLSGAATIFFLRYSLFFIIRDYCALLFSSSSLLFHSSLVMFLDVDDDYYEYFLAFLLLTNLLLISVLFWLALCLCLCPPSFLIPLPFPLLCESWSPRHFVYARSAICHFFLSRSTRLFALFLSSFLLSCPSVAICAALFFFSSFLSTNGNYPVDHYSAAALPSLSPSLLLFPVHTTSRTCCTSR